MVLSPICVDKSVENIPATPEALLARLESLDINFELHKHRAVFSVAEADEIDRSIAGAHTRNLFVRDKKENMFLITLLADTRIDLGKLAPLIGAGRLSFGSPERLMKNLGVSPGSVTPFAMINDRAHKVTLILDKEMMESDIVNYHPLINTMTVSLTPDELMTFLNDCNCKPKTMDLTPARGA